MQSVARDVIRHPKCEHKIKKKLLLFPHNYFSLFVISLLIPHLCSFLGDPTWLVRQIVGLLNCYLIIKQVRQQFCYCDVNALLFSVVFFLFSRGCTQQAPNDGVLLHLWCMSSKGTGDGLV